MPEKKEDNLEEVVLQEETAEVCEQPPATDELAAKTAEADELKNRLLRLQADYDNFRRRSREDMQQLSIFVSAELLGKFLPVLDNFKRAADSNSTKDAENLRKGIELIYRQFEKAMQDAGVEEIASLGAQFDPNLHEAVMRCENSELPDGQIDMVLEEGYKLKDKVIRHSKVRVVNN